MNKNMMKEYEYALMIDLEYNSWNEQSARQNLYKEGWRFRLHFGKVVFATKLTEMEVKEERIQIAKEKAAIKVEQTGTGGDYKITFGKHRGKCLKNLDENYLDWLTTLTDKTELRSNVLEYINGGMR